jgi:hypothetical protein
MSWENYGSWVIDHKIPCSSWNLSKSDEQQMCFSYKNLQPLWHSHNLKKSDKYDEHDKTTYIANFLKLI